MNVVLLFEGTGNSSLGNPSVISELAYQYEVKREDAAKGIYRQRILPESEDRLKRRLANDGKGQVVHIESGSGNYGEVDAEVTGRDWPIILKKHYEFLKDLLEPRFRPNQYHKVKLFVFGFSRGAYQAKLFVNGLTYFGLSLSGDEFVKRIKGLKKNIKVRRNIPTIEFVGLIDTVCSTVNPPTGWKEVRIPSIVKKCRHAVAINEYRWWFEPQLLADRGGSRNVEEMWFLGCHADVGWAYNGTRNDPNNQAYTSTFAKIMIAWLLDGLDKWLQWRSLDLFEKCKPTAWDFLQLMTNYGSLIHRSYDARYVGTGAVAVRNAGKSKRFHVSVEGLYALREMPVARQVYLPMCKLTHPIWHLVKRSKVIRRSLYDILSSIKTLQGGDAYGLAYSCQEDVRQIVRIGQRVCLTNLHSAHSILSKARIVRHAWRKELEVFTAYLLDVLNKMDHDERQSN